MKDKRSGKKKSVSIAESPLKYTGFKNHYQDRAYEKWLAYWQTKVDWAASPEGSDVWDAAVETIADYVLCFDTLTPEELATKIRTLKNDAS